MRKIIIIAILALASTTLIGQYGALILRDFESFVTTSGKYLMQINGNSSIEGSPYLTEDFVQSSLLINNNWYREIELKFDIYQGYFEVKMEDGVFALSPVDNGADTILYNDEIFVRKDISDGTDVKIVYLSMLGDQDDYSLFKQYNIRMDESVEARGYSDAKPAEYKMNPPKYYIFKGFQKWEVKGVKSLAEVFNIETKTIKNFMKEKKYKVSDENDLLEIVKYYSGFVNQ